MSVLKSSWSIYYHTFADDDWSIESYNKLFTFNTIEEYWKFMNNLPCLSNGMFFIMRGEILPIWEDDSNKNGGAWTLFVSNNQIETYFINISAHMVNEQLINLPNEINGLSITPKHKSFSIKIWNKNMNESKNVKFNEQVNLVALGYKKHSI
jgi:translation initiation factor 4E